MSERVVLHIGAPKSGTTYLQTVLFANRSALAEAGVLVPGTKHVGEYTRVALAMRTEQLGSGPAARTYREFVRDVEKWAGTSVLSQEWFCLTPDELIGRAVDDFGGERVEVVYSARNFVTQVPAAWQETLKLGAPETIEEFVGLLDRPGERWSWWSMDPAEVLERWARFVPAERISVVTVPPRGAPPDLLFERFAAAFGFDPSVCDTSVATPNESLGVQAAELMRRLGPEVDRLVDFDSLHWQERYRWLRRYLGHRLLVPQPGGKIGLREETVALLEARAAASADRLRAAGYRIVGSLDDLTGMTLPPGAVHPDDVPAEEILDVAIPVMARLVARVREETLRAEEAEAKLRKK